VKNRCISPLTSSRIWLERSLLFIYSSQTAPLTPQWTSHWLQDSQHHFPHSPFLSACLYLHSALHAHHSTRSLMLSNTNLLSVPFLRTSFGARSFSITAPKIWNSLPPACQICNSTDTLHRHLKTHYFQQEIPICLAPSFLRLRFGFCWPLCAFINYTYLLKDTEKSQISYRRVCTAVHLQASQPLLPNQRLAALTANAGEGSAGCQAQSDLMTIHCRCSMSAHNSKLSAEHFITSILVFSNCKTELAWQSRHKGCSVPLLRQLADQERTGSSAWFHPLPGCCWLGKSNGIWHVTTCTTYSKGSLLKILAHVNNPESGRLNKN